jgi:hypothetical protein
MPYCGKRFWTRRIPTSCLLTAINGCREKCAYMFNVYKNQPSRQTGSRNLTGQKTLPMVWGTYMKLVTKYQISAINSCGEKCPCMFNEYKKLNTKVEIHMLVFLYPLPEGGGGILFYLSPSKIFFSVSVDGRNLIFGHKLHIGTPYGGKPFLTRRITTSCLLKCHL